MNAVLRIGLRLLAESRDYEVSVVVDYGPTSIILNSTIRTGSG